MDLVFTTATSVLTILCLLWITRLLAHGFGPDGFGAYSLVRRVSSAMDPVVTLCMYLSLTRCVAVHRNPEDRHRYLVAAILLGTASTAAIFALCLPFYPFLSGLLFNGAAGYQPLFLALLVFLSTYVFYIVLYSYYRGAGRMLTANLWQAGAIALGPLAVALLFGGSSPEVVVILMAGLLGCSLFPLGWHLNQIFRASQKIKGVWSAMKEILRYGLPRVPGGFAFGGILSAGPFIAPYAGSLREAGYLVAGQSILRVVEGGTEALGRTAFPRIAQLFSDGGVEAVRPRVSDLMAFTLHFGIYATVHLILWSHPLILVWLGPDYLDAVPVLQIVLLSLIPYLMFVTMRTVLDAIEVKAVVTQDLFVSLSVTALASILFTWLGGGVLGLALGTSLGLSALGSLVTIRLWRRFALQVEPFHLPGVLGSNLVLGLIGGGLCMVLDGRLAAPSLLGIAIAAEVLLFSCYVGFLRKLGVPWVSTLESRLFSGGKL